MFEISNIGIVTVFAAGFISFVSPCVLPLVPGYVSYIAGRSLSGGPVDTAVAPKFAVLGTSLCFVLGFSTVFIILGASASMLGQLLLSYRYELNIVGGVIVILFGFFMLGVIRPAWMQREFRLYLDIPGGRPLSAYVLGLAFAFGWTPCIGPILGAILTVNAASMTVPQGVALLAVYSLGLGVPFLGVAVFAEKAVGRLKTMGRPGRYLRTAAGGVMILMGVAMVTGRLTELSYWLLDNFPLLASIG